MKKTLLVLTLIVVSTVAFARPHHYYEPSRSERNLQTAAGIVNITLGALTGLKILSSDAVIVPSPVIVTPTPTYYAPPPPPRPVYVLPPPPPPPRHYHRPSPPRHPAPPRGHHRR